MGLYRIWLDPRGVGRHAIGRQYPAAKPYHVDIEAPDMAAAKKRANSSPLWTGEITTLRSGDTKRAGAERRLYVGLKGGKRVIFRSDATPTKETHPQYGAVIGPFRTVRAARLMASPGCMLQTVAEAERVAGRQTRSGDTKRAHHGNRSRKSYLSEFKVERIPLDRGGYDRRGRYYGVGLPLYRVTAEGVETGMRVNGPRELELIVRAPDARHARAEALRRPHHWGGWR